MFMKERIIIQPDADNSMACWALTSPAGITVRHGSLGHAAAAIDGRQVVLAVSGSHILLTHTELPSSARRHPERIIPYALEEYLADDVDDLHFAHISTTTDNTVNVAVTSRAHMSDWLSHMEQAGIEPDVVTPDVLLLPLKSGSWSVHVSPDSAIVRTGDYSGFSCETGNLSFMLANAAREAGEQAPATIFLYKNADSTVVPSLDDIDIDVITVDKTGNVIELMDAQTCAAQALDLRQGMFRKPFRFRGDLRPWRLTAMVAGVWLLLVLITSIVEYAYLTSRESALREQISDVYLGAFPGSQQPADPRAQMESKLKQIRKGGAGTASGFLHIMGQAGKVISTSPAISVSSLDYRDGKLGLEVTMKDLSTLDDFKQQLTTRSGLTVDVQSASSSGGQATAQISLRKR